MPSLTTSDLEQATWSRESNGHILTIRHFYRETYTVSVSSPSQGERILYKGDFIGAKLLFNTPQHGIA